jgi:hypothetical protein
LFEHLNVLVVTVLEVVESIIFRGWGRHQQLECFIDVPRLTKMHDHWHYGQPSPGGLRGSLKFAQIVDGHNFHLLSAGGGGRRCGEDVSHSTSRACRNS